MERMSIYLSHATNRSAALLLTLLLLPIWLIRSTATLLRGGRLTVISSHPGRGSFPALALIDRAERQRHLWLLNVLRGDMNFIGAPVGEAAPGQKPGIVSPTRLRRSVGIAHQSTAADDEAFFERATISERLGLLCRYALSFLYSRHRHEHVDRTTALFGVRIDSLSMREAIEELSECRKKKNQVPMKVAAFVNPDCLNKAIADRDYHHLLNQSDWVLPDGSGLRIAARILCLPLAENVNGTDLFPLLCERAADTGQKLFFYGGRPGVALRAAEEMRQRFPGLKIVGCLDGYSHRRDDGVAVRAINASGADVVLAGLGAPQQETWLHEHRNYLSAAVGIGVGGLFDFYSGDISRAPLWMREAGFEWVWRILQEPGTKWRRYVLGNPLFLARVIREKWIRNRTGEHAGFPLQLPTAAEWAGTLQPDDETEARTPRMSKQLWRIGLVITAAAKRGLDLAVAGGALIALSPLLLLAAAAIRLESPGPLLFRQVRVGQRGKLFSMLKFRSMYTDAEERLAALRARNESDGGVLFKMKDDPRITRVGKVIRRFSIDELPQILNVLRGEMSIVGPRPALPSEVEQYASADRKRLQTKPGLTCLWQIGGRSDLSFAQQVSLDVDYLRQQNLLADMRIIAKTFPAVISGKGAY